MTSKIIHTTIILAFLLAGCVTEEKPQTTSTTQQVTTTRPPPAESRIQIPYKENIIIDGNTGDWETIPTLIQDETGDVMTKKYADYKLYEFDITNIRAAHDKTNLYLLIEFDKDLQYYFTVNRNSSKVIGTLFIDADNDKDTGGYEFFSERGGIESTIELWSGLCIKDEMVCVSGGSYIDTEEAEFNYYIEIIPTLHENGNSSLTIDFSSSLDSKDNPESVYYGGNIIEVKIPFSKIGILHEKSLIIRILLAEGNTVYGNGWEGTFSDEVIGELSD